MLESGKRGGAGGGRGSGCVHTRTHGHTFPYKHKSHFSKRKGSHKEFPLGIERGGEDKKETREERGLVKKEAGQVGRGEGRGTAALAMIVCIVKVALRGVGGVLKMTWS